MQDIHAQMEPRLAGNPFRGIADLAVTSVQLEWGWVVLVGGVICLFTYISPFSTKTLSFLTPAILLE
jgi:hypothetical protein